MLFLCLIPIKIPKKIHRVRRVRLEFACDAPGPTGVLRCTLRSSQGRNMTTIPQDTTGPQRILGRPRLRAKWRPHDISKSHGLENHLPRLSHGQLGVSHASPMFGKKQKHVVCVASWCLSDPSKKVLLKGQSCQGGIRGDGTWHVKSRSNGQLVVFGKARVSGQVAVAVVAQSTRNHWKPGVVYITI